MHLSLKAGPEGTMKGCTVRTSNESEETKQIVLVNSGESVLLFDLQIMLQKGTSGLIKILLYSDIVHSLLNPNSQEETVSMRSSATFE